MITKQLKKLYNNTRPEDKEIKLMGKVNYETWATRAQTEKKSNFAKVGYFKLGEDGEEAVVRFAYNDPSEFDIVDIHRVKDKNGWWRNISCLRTPEEPIDKCPLCAKKESLKTRFFVKLIQYTKDEAGNIVVTPMVWERPSGFIKEMRNLINTYGDLKESVFKVVRNGGKYNAKGEPNTDVTYTIMYQPPHIYKEELGFVKDFSAFDDFDISKHSYTVRTAEEINAFLATGEFPTRAKAEPAKEAPAMATPVPTVSQTSVNVATSVAPAETVRTVQEAAPVAPVTQPAPAPVAPAPTPASTPAPAVDPTNGRPRRTYVWPENK